MSETLSDLKTRNESLKRASRAFPKYHNSTWRWPNFSGKHGKYRFELYEIFPLQLVCLRWIFSWLFPVNFLSSTSAAWSIMCCSFFCLLHLSQIITARMITGIFPIFHVFHPSFFFFQLNITVFEIMIVVCFQMFCS